VDGFPSTSAVAEVQHLDFTDRATAGTYTLTYDGQTTAALDYDATIAEVQAALDALQNVSSGDITVGGDRLSTTNGTMTFDFLDTAGDVNMLVIDSSSLTPADPSNWLMTEQTKGSDGWISRSSNTVDDVIHGVTLHLHDTTDSNGVTLHLHDTTDSNGEDITLTRDTASITDKLNAMVEAYNSAVALIQSKTGYNEALEAAGPLMGDYIISTMRSQLLAPLIGQTSGFIVDIDTFLMPAQIGLELDRDGMLSLDSSVFSEAIAEDYMGVLALIGADKTGSSDSNTIEFYGASSDYTTAGNYDVEVVISGGVISTAKIKLSTESTYRDMTIDGNVVTGNSTFNDNGYPVYPEHSLQLSVDLSVDDTFTATVRVKQGFAGALEDSLGNILKTTTGSIQIDQEYVDDQIELLEDKIENEEERLINVEERLVTRYAYLESTLTLLQSQMAALGFGAATG
jgi:flagellar hook-associated protein 2